MNDTTLAKCYALLKAKLRSKGRGEDWDDDMRDMYDLVLLPLPDNIGLKAVVDSCMDAEWPPDVSVIKGHAQKLMQDRINTMPKIADDRRPYDVPPPPELKAKMDALFGRRESVRVDRGMERIGNDSNAI